MEHFIAPYCKGVNPFAWWDNAFTVQELDWLQQKATEATQAATIKSYENGVVDEKTRRSEVNWMHNTPETEWVFKRLSHAIASLNTEFFNFDLTGFGEPIQLTNYSANNQGTYRWHQDFGNAGLPRKLSLVLQLSDPDDYEGGELQLLTNTEPTVASKKRGLITVFPSWTLHQVTPVVRGNRQSLVSWIGGPSFK